MTYSRPLWHRLGLHLWIFWALACAPLLDLLRRYPEFFVAHDMGATQIGALLGLLLIALPLPWVLAATKLRRTRWAPALLVPPWLLLGLALCIGAGTGAAALPIAAMASWLALWSYLKLPQVRRYCTWLLPIALVAPFVLLSDSSLRKLWLPQAPTPASLSEAAPPATPGASAFVLVLDELPVSTLLNQAGEIDARRFPHLASLADRSHWFDNVVSVSSSTPKAVSALLAGVRLDQEQLPIARDLPVNLFTLLAPTHRISALEPVTRLCPPQINRLEGSTESTRDWLTDTWILALHLVVPPPFNDRLPSVADQWAGFGEMATAPTVQQGVSPVAPPEEAPTWKELFAQAGRATRRDRLSGFDQLLGAVDNRRGALYFGHLLLPHRPWAYLPSGALYWPGRYREPKVFQEKEWPNSPSYTAQAYQRHLLQAEFVDRLIGRLVARLRERGVYDETLIAITADHGISFLPGAPKRAVTATTRAEVLQVPLILKLPGQTAGVHHDEQRSTLDLLPTLLQVMGADTPDALAGNSLLGPAAATPEVAPWQPALAQRQRLFGALDREAALFTFGPLAEWTGRRLDEVAAAVDDGLEIDLEGPGWTFESPEGASVLPALVYGRIRGADSDRPLALAIAIDGTIVATTVQDPEDRTASFRALLPESVLTPGTHELAVVVIDPATGRGRLPSQSVSD